jgi:hypothetical protein
LRETLGRYVERFGNGRPPVMMMRLEVLVDQVKRAMFGLARLARERTSNAGDVELPVGRLRQSR